MAKDYSVRQNGLLSQRNALLDDQLRLEKEVNKIKRQLAELEAVIYLETCNCTEQECDNTEDILAK